MQETKLSLDTERNIPGYTSEYKHYTNLNGNVCGGLVIFFKNYINYEGIRVDDPKDNLGNTKIETQLFRVHLGGSPFMLANLYSRGCDLNSLEHISTFLSAEDKLRDCLINGDFNAHNTIWGSSHTNRQGRAVWEWAEQNNKVLLNDGSVTRVDQGTGVGTCIDLTFASPKFSANSNWVVLEDNWGSDHLPFCTTIYSQNCQKGEKMKMKNLSLIKQIGLFLGSYAGRSP